MKLALRSRARAELLDAVRAELARTHDELHATFRALDTQLQHEHERHEEHLTAAVRTLKEMSAGLAERGDQLVATLDRLADTWRDLMVSQCEQQRALLGVLERLNTALEQPRPPTPTSVGRVLGGTVDAGSGSQTDEQRVPANGLADRRVVFLDGVEVRCRFADNRWVGGFEICDVYSDHGALRYRLRRRSDGYVLPTLFDEASVREATSSRVHGDRDSIR